MVDHVEGHGEVNRHGQSTVWGAGLVGTPGYSMREGEKGGNGGVVGTEAMLGSKTSSGFRNRCCSLLNDCTHDLSVIWHQTKFRLVPNQSENCIQKCGLD